MNQIFRMLKGSEATPAPSRMEALESLLQMTRETEGALTIRQAAWLWSTVPYVDLSARGERYFNETYTAIYFITAGPFIKIGKADNTKRRTATLQTGNPYEMEVVQELFVKRRDGLRVERFFHRLFSDDRAQGEWFSYTPQIVRTLRKIFSGLDIDFDHRRALEICKNPERPKQ